MSRSPEMLARIAAFFATRDDLRKRRRQLMDSAAEMPAALFERTKAQLDEERQAWRAEGERLAIDLKEADADESEG